MYTAKVVGGSDEYPQSLFWSKNKKKIGIPLHTLVLLYKSGVQGGIHYTDMFPDYTNNDTGTMYCSTVYCYYENLSMRFSVISLTVEIEMFQ